jgi:Flp pilus assembly protein TadD
MKNPILVVLGMNRRKRRAAKTKQPSRKQPSQIWVIPLVVFVALCSMTILFVSPSRFHSWSNSLESRSVGALPIQIAATNPVAVPLARTNLPPESPTTLSSNYVSDTEKSAAYQNSGNKYLEEGRFADAIAQYRMAVKLSPQDEDAHYNLALALAKAGNSAEAQKEYLEAIDIYPVYPEAHNNLGNLLLAEGNLEAAVTHFKAALATSPRDPTIHNNLGHALARQGEFTKAIVAFQEALRLKSDYVEARYNLAEAYLEQKQFSEAIAQFTHAIQNQPDFEPAHRGLEKARQLQGQ